MSSSADQTTHPAPPPPPAELTATYTYTSPQQTSSSSSTPLILTAPLSKPVSPPVSVVEKKTAYLSSLRGAVVDLQLLLVCCGVVQQCGICTRRQWGEVKEQELMAKQIAQARAGLTRELEDTGEALMKIRRDLALVTDLYTASANLDMRQVIQIQRYLEARGWRP